jgi:NAD(P)-dependent dehydrogenase (short-subunit alcohol dehydrogenase family)
MSYTLKGRRVLITGASKGLGKVIAELFAAQDAHVAINYMSNSAVADDLAARLAVQYGVRAIAIKAVRTLPLVPERGKKIKLKENGKRTTNK